MDERQKNVAVWVSLPLVGLLLLVIVFAAYGAVYVMAPIALIVALVVLFVFISGRKRG
jgi:hypothetical protein